LERRGAERWPVEGEASLRRDHPDSPLLLVRLRNLSALGVSFFTPEALTCAELVLLAWQRQDGQDHRAIYRIERCQPHDKEWLVGAALLCMIGLSPQELRNVERLRQAALGLPVEEPPVN
jgi:hypothetical protein